MPEVINNLSPQLITPATDAKAIASTIIKVVKETTHLPSQTDCRTYADTHFNWSSIAQRIREVLLKEV
jgi:glycosyltransferase involved in cell wall biosynthesis